MENNVLAEAACYAILCRIAPVLRHDIAGLVQPVRLLLAVLEKRIMKPEFDRDAILENVASVSALTKDAATGSMNAMGWMNLPSRTSVGPLVNLRSSVDELIELLALEFSENSLTVTNNISDETARVPQSLVRTVLVGSLLAFCDAPFGGGNLIVTLSADKLSLMLLKDIGLPLSKNTNNFPPERPIRWEDVDALAARLDLKLVHGEGSVNIDLQDLKR
jgi:hypothetical protein